MKIATFAKPENVSCKAEKIFLTSMGFFDLFKRRDKSEAEQDATANDLRSQLDAIEKEVYSKLKPLGFKKFGRTFNRRLDEGIIQVINFQSGQFPIGQHYTVPGLRESQYGKFVVNLGVCIESLHRFQYPTVNKKYYKEYECEIRCRLGTLIYGEDYWWSIKKDSQNIIDEITNAIETKGFNWFSGLDTKEKIVKNNGKPPYTFSPRAKLDVALIVWFDNKEMGSELFKEYYHSIKPTNSGHKKYVKDLANELNIELG